MVKEQEVERIKVNQILDRRDQKKVRIDKDNTGKIRGNRPGPGNKT
jgi:hypothetical protein